MAGIEEHPQKRIPLAFDIAIKMINNVEASSFYLWIE